MLGWGSPTESKCLATETVAANIDYAHTFRNNNELHYMYYSGKTPDGSLAV